MTKQQEFWETLKLKYEEKNRTLQQKERELRLKFEAMDAVIGSRNKTLPASDALHSEQMSGFCTCPPPQEKSGFFKCIFSIFGSSKPKNAPLMLSSKSNGAPTISQTASNTPISPLLVSAPQDNPTKESKTESLFVKSEPNQHEQSTANTFNKTVTSNKLYKYENCMCDPCESDNPPEGISRLQRESNKRECTCSICSKSFSSVLPAGTTNEGCCCNFFKDNDCICTEEIISSLPLSGVENTATKSVSVNNPSNVKREKETRSLSVPEKLSLNSIDLFYMQNIHDLASQEKKLLHNIKDLEQKTKVYENVFEQYKNINFASNNRQQSACCPCNNSASQSDQKTNAELKLENFLLKNELKDMRLEVRQYLERMEGPMQFKIESERYKCLQLDHKLEEAAKELANVQEFFQKEINSFKMQLCTANKKIYHLTEVNEQLTAKLQTYQNKCSKLEEDLIRQKISEAETIKSLQETLNTQMNAKVEKDECNLHQIARELSKILKDCEPCGECLTLPEDLTAAAKLLKSLTDIIENKLPKEFNNEELLLESDTKVSPKAMDVPTDNLGISLVESQASGAAEIEENIASSKATVEGIDNTPSQLEKEDISERVDEKLEKTTDEKKSVVIADSISDNRVVTEEKQIFNVPETESFTKSKTACKCIKSKNSTKVDQIWPKSDVPVVMKDSSLIETTAISSKKKCNCSNAKKILQSQQVSQAISQSDRSKKTCKCGNLLTEDEMTGNQVALSLGDGVNLIQSTTSERFKLAHQVTADTKELLKSETSVKCLKVKENFPFDIDTQVDVLNKPPDGVHVTTTITNSGTLEVITEGPEGVIETTLIYTNSGNVEVVTEILELKGKGKTCNRNKIKTPSTVPTGKVLAIEAPQASEFAVGPSSLITDLNVDVSKSGFAMNPNCQCRNCPVLELMALSNKADDASKPKTILSEFASNANVDASKNPLAMNSNCRCRDCPVLKLLDLSNNPIEATPDLETEVNLQLLKNDFATNTCKCRVCPISELTDNKPEKDLTPDSTNLLLDKVETDAENVVVPTDVAQNLNDIPTTAVNTLDSQVVKSLSLSLHVEDENDLTKLVSAADEDKKTS